MKLDPYWVTGFVDGEGTFYIGINHQPTMQSGYQILPEFRVVQHQRDIKLLYALKDFFRAGVVRVNHDERYELRIRNLNAIIQTVIPHFEKYQLHTQKQYDFEKFSEIVRIIKSGEHLTKKGILRIIEISAKMNRGKKLNALEIKKALEG